MATPEAQAEGQNPAYKPTYRHHQPDQGKRLEHLALGHARDTREAPRRIGRLHGVSIAWGQVMTDGGFRVDGVEFVAEDNYQWSPRPLRRH